MASIQGIYVALFGRPADPAGLAFFNEATNNGADLTAIGDLAASDEYQDRFAGMSSEEIVNSIYNSLFERDGEPEGVAFYVAGLEDGTFSIKDIAIRILDGAQGSDLDTVNAKIAAADLFTAGLDTDAEIAAYNGMDAAQVGVDYLAQINSDNPADTPLSDEWILKLFDDPGEGQAPGGGGGGGGSSATFFLTVEDDQISFGGTATGIIEILSVTQNDDDTQTIVAKQGGITASADAGDGIAIASGQKVMIKAADLDVLQYIQMPSDAELIVDVEYDELSGDNPALPPYKLSSIEVDGKTLPWEFSFDDANLKTVWDAISTADGDIATKFKLFWAELDNAYYKDPEDPDYYNKILNEAKVVLAEEYVEYLNDGNPAIIDIVQTKVSGEPNFDARQQSLHDNILGELNNAGIADRFGSDDPRSDAAKEFGARPWESGQPPKEFSNADKWDALNEVNRPDLVQTLVDLADGPTADGFEWITDRAPLEAISVGTDPEDAGNDVIAFNINEDGAQGSGTPGPAFARYQGAKLREDGSDFDIAHGGKVSFDFYIDSDWADDGLAQLSGVWVQMATPETNAQSWSIVEYLDAGASAERILNQHENDGMQPTEGFTGFRFWASNEGYKHYVPHEADGWVNLTFEFTKDAHIWYINGTEVFRDEGPVTDTATVIETLIFNSQNFGVDQTYYYDNVDLTGISTLPQFYEAVV